MSASKHFPLFSRFGVEIEYMIVHADNLDVKPIADLLMEAASGSPCPEIVFGPISWNNELSLHVVEFKLTKPAHDLIGVDHLFQQQISKAIDYLKPLGASLLPGGMHPWMNPKTETRLWPHEGFEIYRTFHTLFDCFRHGWANLQSVHLNLPFKDDLEFRKLHAAIRFLIPLIPALSSSTPFVEGKEAKFLDYRMEVYRTNATRIPSVTGLVIPDAVLSEEEYKRKILAPIYSDLKQIDLQGILQEEWVNARGAIARFERNTIEIRVIDSQENPLADVAVLQAVVHVLKKWTTEEMTDRFNKVSTETLSDLFQEIIKAGEEAIVSNPLYLEVLGYKKPMKAKEIWQDLIQDGFFPPLYRAHLDLIFREGTLATRLLRRFRQGESLKTIYHHLSHCLVSGEFFV